MCTFDSLAIPWRLEKKDVDNCGVRVAPPAPPGTFGSLSYGLSSSGVGVTGKLCLEIGSTPGGQTTGRRWVFFCLPPTLGSDANPGLQRFNNISQLCTRPVLRQRFLPCLFQDMTIGACVLPSAFPPCPPPSPSHLGPRPAPALRLCSLLRFKLMRARSDRGRPPAMPGRTARARRARSSQIPGCFVLNVSFWTRGRSTGG